MIEMERAVKESLVNRLMSSFRVYTFSNVVRFEGKFQRSDRHGRGTYVFANDPRSEGDWREGRFETQTSWTGF